ncbi:hypothetical protein D3C80_1748720 [compost metagenome]
MHHTGHFLCQHILGARRFAAVLVFFFQRINLFNAQEGEELQEAINVRIRGVDPELVEFVRAGFFRSQPYRTAFGFTKLGTV